MWQSFIDFADQLSGNEIECLAAEKTACLTFQLFNQVLDEYAQLDLTSDLK